MKNIIAMLAGSIYVLGALAQEPPQNQGSTLSPGQKSSQWEDKYCASAKDDHTIVMNGKTELVVDITLGNGTKITTDGYLVKKDGTKTALKSGECVDKNGNIIQGKEKSK